MILSLVLAIFWTQVAHNLALSRQCKRADIHFLLDSSKSINQGNQTNYGKAKNFIKDFAKYFDIGPDDVQIGVTTYSYTVKLEFPMNRYGNKRDLLKAIDEITYHDSGTYTGLGIQRVLENGFTTKSGDRPDVDDFLIVMTDGNTHKQNDEQRLIKQSKILKRKGITTLAIGIGNSINEAELQTIASSDEYVFKATTFASLKRQVLDKLIEKVCDPTTPKPTTTPAPKLKCGEKVPSDIYFVFSPTDLGLEKVSEATSFIRTIIKQEVMDTGFSFGIRSGPCPSDLSFKPSSHTKLADLNSRLQSYLTPSIPQILQSVSSSCYPQSSSATKMVVLVVDGGSKLPSAVHQKISSLIRQGIKVYVADLSFQKTEIGQAITLSGSNYYELALDFVNRLCSDDWTFLPFHQAAVV